MEQIATTDKTASAYCDEWALRAGYPDVGTYKQANFADRGEVGTVGDEGFNLDIFPVLQYYDQPDAELKQANRYFLFPVDDALIAKLDTVVESGNYPTITEALLALCNQLRVDDQNTDLNDTTNYKLSSDQYTTSTDGTYGITLNDNAITTAGDYWLIAITPDLVKEPIAV